MVYSSSLAIRKLITNRRHLAIWRNYFGSVKIVVATVSSVEQDALGTVIDYRRYGSLNKLLRATGYVLRFKANILAKLRNKLKNF